MLTLNSGHVRKYLRWQDIRGLLLNIGFDGAGGLRFFGCKVQPSLGYVENIKRYTIW